MKRALFVLTVALMIGSAGAYVAGSGSSPSNNVTEGEMAATSSSASATTAAGPNGSKYTVKVWETGQLNNVTDDRLENVSTRYLQLSFKGYIASPTPCHTLKHNLTGSEEDYTLNVYLEETGQMCAQQRVMKTYRAEMENNRPFDLEVQHEGETVRTLKTGPGQMNQDRSVLDAVISFFSFLL